MGSKTGYSNKRRPFVSDGTSENVLLHPGMDKIFDILSTHHRRLVLLLLKEGVVESDTDVMVRGGDDSKETEIALTHGHLPKLDEAGYIEWNRDTGKISKGPRFEEIEPLLELMENHADELPPGWP